MANPACGFRIELGEELHPGLAAGHGLEQPRFGQGKLGCELGCHVIGAANLLGVIAGEVEVAGMGPEAETLFVQGHQTAIAIDDRASLTNRLGGLGLDGVGPGLEVGPIHHLQPGEAAGQSDQPGAEQSVDRQQPNDRHGLDRHNLLAGIAATTAGSGAATGRHQ